MENSRAEAVDFLKQQFDTEPSDRGIALENPVILDEKPVAEEPEEVKEEVAEGQDEPKEVSETVEETEEETHAEGQAEKIRAKEFASQAGWTLEEFYRDVTVPTDEGEVTLSEVVDGFKSLRAENETLRNERQQLEQKAITAQAPVQQYSPEALELAQRAKYLQEQLDNIDWVSAEPDSSRRMELKMEFRENIDKLSRTATVKQQEYAKEQEKQMREYQARVQAQLKKDIPEWRSDKVMHSETDGLTRWLKSEGAEAETIDQVLKFNPWATKMFRRLWKLEQAMNEQKKAVKKVQKVPKSLHPTSRQETKLPTAKDVGKKLSSAKSRRQFDKILMESEFG